MVVRLRAIGECGIDVGPVRIGPDAELAFAVLLVLTLAGGHTVARRRLTDLLWPGAPDDRARHNLRQTLYKLRQLGAPVESESLHVWLPAEAIAPHPLLDVEAEGDGLPPAELLRADRPFGEFLAGYVPTFSAPFAAWLEEQRSVVHARLRRAALTRLHDERRRGDWAAVETLARKVLQLDALNEEATLALAEATVMSGSKRAAIGLLDAYLHDLGPDAGDIRLPATLLRRRIAERLPPSLSPPDGDACFVGRADSMAFLHDQFRLTRTAGARTVLLWGDAGIGKSRLTTEFARLAVMEGAQLARVGCQARDVERPLSMFVDVVPHLLALPGAIGCSPESMTYLRRLTAHDPTVLEPAAETREAELLFAYVRRAIFDLVDAVASEATLVLVLEDVHWLDEQSWRVLRELIGWLERRRVLVVLTSRLPHATPTRPARSAAGVVEHRLGPLDRAASLALFDAATPGRAVPEEYREWCVQVADGNPLFICACAHESSAANVGKVPRSLSKMIEERIQATPPAAFRILQTIALLGAEATVELILLILGITRSSLLDGVSELHARRLVSTDQGRLTCQHTVIADTVLACSTPYELAILHRGAAECLERRLLTSRESKVLWECAQHWIQGGDHSRAAHIVRQYARHLLGIGAARAARDAFERGLTLASADDDKLGLLDGVALASSICGSWQQCLTAVSSANTIRRTLGLPRLHELLEIEARWKLAERTDVLLSDTERILNDVSRQVPQRLSAGVLALIFSDHLCDEHAARRIHAACESLGGYQRAPELNSVRRTAQLIFHSSFGDLAVALDLARDTVKRRRPRDTMRMFRDCCRASIPLRRCGLHHEADGLVREAFALAEDHQMIAPKCLAADILASSAFEQDRIDEATLWLHIASDRLNEIDNSEATLSVSYLGVRLALSTRDIEMARSWLRSSHSDVLADISIRRRVEGLAAHLGVALASDDTDTIQRLTPRLHADHIRARSFGGQDYATAILVRSLRSTRQHTTADAIAEGYIKRFRRERSCVPPYFHRIGSA